MVWNEQLKRNISENWKVAQLKDIFNVSGKLISRDDCQTDAYYTPIDVIPNTNDNIRRRFIRSRSQFKSANYMKKTIFY